MIDAISAVAGRRSARAVALVGSALGTTLALAPAAMAQNVVYNGPGPYTLTKTDTISGGPRTVDITSTNGDITLDLTTVNVLNNGTARGAGIAATETGAGKVSIKSGTVTATGTGPTTAIDARSTTGAILVNSGTVSATSTNSTALQASSSAGGAVTINADVTTGGLRGIFTSFSGGVTTITSNFATANGINTPNAIIGQGSTVVVNSKTATLTGNGSQGTAIFVQSGAGGATITSGTTSTQGFGQAGVFLGYSAGTGLINSTTATTAGDFARGIYSSTVGNEVINSTTVTTTGANATGIYVSPTSSTDANAPALGNVTVNSGTITTKGDGAGGILLSRISAQGAANASVLTGINDITSGSITTAGANAYGIQTGSTTGATTIKSSSIATTGFGASGILVQPSTGATTITSADLSTSGMGATGILVSPSTGTSTGATQINTSGTLSTKGDDSSGIFVRATTGTVGVNNTGTITIAGAGSSGINIAGSTGATTVASNVVNTGGANANAINISGTTGTQTLTSTSVTATGGANANGIRLNATGAGNLIVNSGTVTVNNANGIFAQTNGGAIAVTAGTTTSLGGQISGGSFTYGILALSAGNNPAGTVSVNSTNASAFDNAAIQATGAGTVTVTSGIATATGASSAIVASSRLGDLAVNATTTTTTRNTKGFSNGAASGTLLASATVGNVAVTAGTVSGETTAGIVASAGGNAAITATSVTGGGDGFRGLGVTAGTGIALNIGLASSTGSTVTANRADAIFASTQNGPITATIGTASTVGANANAIYLVDNGTTGSITANVTGSATTTGAGSRALTAQTVDGNIAITAAKVTTTGAFDANTNGRADAITAFATGTGAATITADTTSTTGQFASAIFGSAGGAVNITSNVAFSAGEEALTIGGVSRNAGVTIAATNTTASGLGARAINAQTTNGDIAITVGTASTTGDVSASGNSSDAVTAFNSTAGNGAITINAGTTSATGRYASAIFASGGGAVTITSGTASTTGADTDAIGGVSRNGDVLITATTTTATGGGGGEAVAANATTGNATVNLGTATSAASRGVSVMAGKLATATIGTVSGGGDGASGITLTGGTGGVLNIGSAASNGTATSTTNTRTGVVTVRRADAVFATATNGALLANIGSAKATGAGADAVRLIANGTGGAVTANITGVLSSTSGTGLFIDPPGAVVIDVAAGASISGALNGINTTGASNTITNRGTISSTGGAGILATGATMLVNSGSITGANNIAVQLGATNDTVTLLTGSTVTGRIVGGGGTDAAVLSGTGNVATAAQTVAGFAGFDNLTVQNGYWTAVAASPSSFGTTVTTNAGTTLDVTNGATGLVLTAPAIVNNGALIVRSGAASAGSTFGAGVVTGGGTVLFTGAGTATLGGTNTIQTTGLTTIDGGSTVLLTGTQGGSFVTGATGTLQIGNGGTTGVFTGSLVDNGTLLVNRSDAFTFAGPLSGAGNIVKQGAGQLVFGSGYAFTGVTTILGGSVRLTTPVAANTELDLEGSGQLDLSGTTQRVAELAGASPLASLNIAGGSLTVVQNTDTIFAGSIVGAGTFTKAGTGRLNFTGVSTYAGPTTISGGTLAVNGSIVSPVLVVTGGTLGGTGSVGSVTIASGGTYAPGNSIGTQTVNGNLTFAAGSIFAVEANAAGQSDRVNVTGTATLQGGAVPVTPTAGAYGNLTNYTILTAAGGVTGAFASVSSTDTTLSPFLSYGANAVTLTLARNNVVFTGMGATGNQAAVGGAITTLGVNSSVYRALLPLSAAATSTALGQLSGELYASLPAVLADGSKQVREAVLARATTPGDGFGLWATGTRTLAGSRNQFGLAPVIGNRWTAIGGVDFTLSGLRMGIDGGYIEDETRVRRFGSHAKTETKLVGGHVGYAQGPMSLVIGGDYAWHDIRADRALGVAGLAGATTADTNAHTVQGYAEAGYGMTVGTLTAMPFARFSYVHIVSDAFSEAGGTGALFAARDTRNYKFGSVGLRMTGDAPIGGNVTFQPRMSIAYTHGWDVDGGRTLGFAGTSPLFTVTGTALGEDALDVNAGFDLAFGQRLTAGVGGFGSTSREWSDYGAKASVGLKF